MPPDCKGNATGGRLVRAQQQFERFAPAGRPERTQRRHQRPKEETATLRIRVLTMPEGIIESACKRESSGNIGVATVEAATLGGRSRRQPRDSAPASETACKLTITSRLRGPAERPAGCPGPRWPRGTVGRVGGVRGRIAEHLRVCCSEAQGAHSRSLSVDCAGRQFVLVRNERPARPEAVYHRRHPWVRPMPHTTEPRHASAWPQSRQPARHPCLRDFLNCAGAPRSCWHSLWRHRSLEVSQSLFRSGTSSAKARERPSPLHCCSWLAPPPCEATTK